jgi:hypothetical protein
MHDNKENKDPFIAVYHELVRLEQIRQFVGAGQTTLIRPAGKLQPIEKANAVWKYLERKEPPPPPLPPPALARIELDTGYITFSGGVPVGGYSHLSLFPNGAYSFTGHYHVSGWLSYDTSLVWVVGSNAGTVFTFSHKGRVHGTGESGSRDDDWGDSATNPAIAAAWNDLSAGYSWQWRAGVNADIGQMVDSAVKAIGWAATIISIV